MSTELGLDPSDPLNLLLHNSSDPSNDTDSQDNIQAWSNLSSLWSDPALPTDPSSKSYADMMPMDFSDLSSSMPMDLDFNQSMAIEPSALHYDPMKFGLGMNFAAYDDQYALSTDLMAAQFPFTFQFGGGNGNEVISSGSSASSISDSPQSFTKERRLSVTSSSSSSGASLSPMPESLPSPTTGGYVSDTNTTQPKEEPIPITEVPSNPYTNDPTAELAARVRQAVGVMLAVPMGAQLQGLGAQMLPNSSRPKLPIPRLPRHNSTVSNSPTSTSSSAASTPPPSTPPPSATNANAHTAPLKLALNTQATAIHPSSDSSASYTPVVPTPTTVASNPGLARPKTSHTTIERRYRTNLNARIQSLRMAVPALRVLEDRDGGNGKKIKKNLKGNVIIKGANGNCDSSSSASGPTESEDGTPIDVIDERGFVDGVKVARKCSKANVLGKAVEYIRVLKKRELRLKKEQEGLKKLVEGLVGGAALVKEWEREWRETFGGEEKDEVEGEDGAEGAEDEGEDGEEDSVDDDDDEDERKRKKVKLSATANKKAAERKKATSAALPVVASPVMQQPADASTAGANPVAEKRKRGRPRKVVPPPVTIAPAPAAVPAVQQQSDAMVQDEPTTVDQQWLQQAQAQQGGQQQQPQQYLLAVFALFSFFNSPLTSSGSSSSFFSSPGSHHAHTGTVLSPQPPLAYAPEIISQFTPPSNSNNSTQLIAGGWSWQEYIQLFHLFVSVLVLAGVVASWMGVNPGGFGANKAMGHRRGRSLSVRAFRSRKEEQKKASISHRETGPQGWIRLGEECVLEGRASSLSLYDRIQIYRASTSTASSTSALTTLSLILHTMPGPTSLLSGLAKMRAQSVWEDARNATSKSGSSSTSAKVAEALVFEEVKGVEEALQMLSRARSDIEDKEEDVELLKTPLDVLARLVVKNRVKRHLGRLFVRAVAASSPSHLTMEDDLLASEQYHQGESQVEVEEEEEKSWRQTIEAARQLGGRVEELGRIFERVWKAPSGGVDEDEIKALLELHDDEGVVSKPADVDAEIQALLVALVLYRRLFASQPPSHLVTVTQEEEEGCVTPTAMAIFISPSSSLLSPPPSPRSTPRPKQAQFSIEAEAEDEEDELEVEEEDEEAKIAAAEKKRMLFVLRTALGSRVFEPQDETGTGDAKDDLLEDAKDRVVDLIVDVERKEKRGSSVVSPL